MTLTIMEDFCARHLLQVTDETYLASLQELPTSSQEFLTKLNLPLLNPICTSTRSSSYAATAIAAGWNAVATTTPTTVLAPDMGPAPYPVDQNILESLITIFWYYIYPSFALIRIWMIFFAGFLAPASILFMWYYYTRRRYSDVRSSPPPPPPSLSSSSSKRKISLTRLQSVNVSVGTKYVKLAKVLPSEISSSSSATSSVPLSMLDESPFVAILGIVLSWIVLTDDGYVLEFGRSYGSVVMLMTIWMIRPFHRTKHMLLMLSVLCMCQIFISPWNCEDTEQYTPEPGLYYNSKKLGHLVDSWKTTLPEYSSTLWLLSGDARTGVPYAMNYVDHTPTFHRVWLPTDDDEYLGLDISFPDAGHDWTKPIYLLLSGLNGQSGYLLDFTRSRNRHGSTVILLVARGLDDTPIQGFTFFHGVRTSDAHAATKILRERVKQPDQILAGVGYSLGAIVLNHYVSSAGDDVALDVSVSISGALACKYQKEFARSRRVWQPVIVANMKGLFLWSKWGHRIYHQLGRTNYQKLLRARDVVEADQYAGAMYNGFKDLDEFYDAMSSVLDSDSEPEQPKMKFSIPHLVLQALDDPISSFRTNASNDPNSILYVHKLVHQHDNLVLLLTEQGGHIGWPMGLFSRSWEYMNDRVAADFILAYEQTLRKEDNQST